MLKVSIKNDTGCLFYLNFYQFGEITSGHHPVNAKHNNKQTHSEEMV